MCVQECGSDHEHELLSRVEIEEMGVKMGNAYRYLFYSRKAVNGDSVITKALHLGNIVAMTLESHDHGYTSKVKFTKTKSHIAALRYMRNKFREFDAIIAYRNGALQMLE